MKEEEDIMEKNLEGILSGEINIIIDLDFLSLEDKVEFSCNQFERQSEDMGYCHQHKSVEHCHDCMYRVDQKGKISTKCKSYEPIEFYVRILLPYKQYMKQNG